ncbi:hypothetical protein EXS54_03045 [Patescibacteria group bacterium]|nr:hypothetical protein [Patescibacteria group bacterium]
MSLYLNFILQPLIFLGGVFYSVSLLPQGIQFLTHLDPLFYMINMIRHGMIGTSDVDPWLSFGIVMAVSLGLFILNLRIFQTGWRLRS